MPKVKEYKQSVFTKSKPFKSVSCKPAHIHLKPDEQPYTCHVPIPIPLHWKEEIKAHLDKDVEDEVIEPVPIGEPVVWCAPMVVTPTKDGQLRRIVYLQRLNKQCLRETHHTQSPFKLACQVQQGTNKTVLNATNDYHSVELDEEGKPLTTFIAEWGRFRYKQLHQGYIAAGDAYTRCYDEITKEVPDKVKCVDDALLHTIGIHDNFFRI